MKAVLLLAALVTFYPAQEVVGSFLAVKGNCTFSIKMEEG
jgi:hypothetical protein